MSGHHQHSAEECREVFERLSEYLDQELPEGDCQRLKEHIEGCAPCVEFLESLKRTIHLCHEFRSAQPPQALPEKLKAEMLECYRKMLAARTRGKT
jgi:anti-sigma factor (TIGR02949 family)